MKSDVYKDSKIVVMSLRARGFHRIRKHPTTIRPQGVFTQNYHLHSIMFLFGDSNIVTPHLF